jgi:hypothetical protein
MGEEAGGGAAADAGGGPAPKKRTFFDRMEMIMDTAEEMFDFGSTDIDRGQQVMQTAEYYLVQTGRLTPSHQFPKVLSVYLFDSRCLPDQTRPRRTPSGNSPACDPSPWRFRGDSGAGAAGSAHFRGN